MAQLSTGIPRSNFGQANVNYNLLAQGTLAGEQAKLAASQQKNNRIRANIANVQAQRELDNANAGKIASLLASNPDLMNNAPEQVQQAEEKFLKTGGSTNTNALLLSYLGDTQERKLQADALAKQNQILAFEQQQAQLARQTALATARKNLIEAQRAQNTPTDLYLTNQELKDLQERTGQEYKTTPVTGAKGNTLLKIGQSTTPTESDEMFYTASDLAKLEEDTGLTYKRRPAMQNGKKGFMVSESYAPEDTIEQKTASSFAEQEGKNISDTINRLEDEWIGKGKPVAMANIEIYDDLITGLTNGNITTRTILSFTPEALGIQDYLTSGFEKTNQQAFDRVRGVIFQGLKATLGGQFTAREVDNLVMVAYNRKLTARQNIERLEGARKVLVNMVEAQENIYLAALNGQRYRGPTPKSIMIQGTRNLALQYGLEDNENIPGAKPDSKVGITSRRVN